MKKEREEAIIELKKFVPKGSTIYTIVTKVAQSGMSRRIKAFVIVKNEPLSLDYFISKACKYHLNADGLLVRGCGMDMGFSLVSSVATALYGDYKKINQKWL